MSSKMKLALIGFGVTVFITIILIAGMAIGVRYLQDQTRAERNASLDSVQIMLAFNRILEARQLESLLAKNCVAQALKKIDIGIDQNTKLIRELSKKALSTDVSEYITDRDPDFILKLDEFNSKYGDSWEEPDCNK